MKNNEPSPTIYLIVNEEGRMIFDDETAKTIRMFGDMKFRYSVNYLENKGRKITVDFEGNRYEGFEEIKEFAIGYASSIIFSNVLE